MTGVSVIVPTLNERDFIHDCLASLANQRHADITEILVLDGGSSDGTRELARAAGPLVRVVDNPGVTAASAMNRGIEAAASEVICRADAHAVYAPDYVARCVTVLEETGATVVGGPMRPVGTTPFGRAVAAVTTSPFGVGPGAFHFANTRMDVDTVYLGCWRREKIQALGGYDETNLQWGAEDHELNFRVRQSGGRIVVDPTIRSWYFPRETPRALGRQYFNYGVGKASTLAKHRSLPSWRPLAPAALVIVSVASALAAGRLRGRLLVPAVHAAGCLAVTRALSGRARVDPARVLVAIEICHWAYGAGFWVGVGRRLAGQPFTARPGGAR
jgi:succinoglycan biosynthesis protein ExoA